LFIVLCSLNLEKFVGFKILEYFLTHPREEAYLKEIAKKLQVNPASVKNYCDIFEKEGLIKKKIKGNIHLFSTNNENFCIREMKKAYISSLLNELKIEKISENAVYENFTIPGNAIKLCVDDDNIGNGLHNRKDKLILKNATGAIVDAIEWGFDYTDVPGSPMSDADKGHSIARYTNVDTDDTLADFYDETDPTPGSENIV